MRVRLNDKPNAFCGWKIYFFNIFLNRKNLLNLLSTISGEENAR